MLLKLKSCTELRPLIATSPLASCGMLNVCPIVLTRSNLFLETLLQCEGVVWCVGCLDTLTCAQSLGLFAVSDDKEHSSITTAVYTKDDYSLVDRFESQLLMSLLVLSCCC